MADEEWMHFSQIFPYVSHLIKIKTGPLLVGGAGLPHLVKDLNVIFLSMPTRQLIFKNREWSSYVLEVQPAQSNFENWMQQDILFAQMVRKGGEIRLSSLMADGSQSESDCG